MLAATASQDPTSSQNFETVNRAPISDLAAVPAPSTPTAKKLNDLRSDPPYGPIEYSAKEQGSSARGLRRPARRAIPAVAALPDDAARFPH
jgi:hypothetical protein